MSDFEQQMLYHASPSLLGRKQASLFSFPLSCMSDYREEIAAYREALEPFGISVEYLYCRHQRVYLLIYRKAMLLRYLNRPAVTAFLEKVGYPAAEETDAFLSQCICALRRRINQGGDFPHEIGFFFGYPEEDVFAFIREKGQNFKLSLDWKVYGNEKEAIRIQRSYQRCRNRLMKQAASGASILSLLTPIYTHAAF